MNTPIERLQTALETLGLKAVEQRLENLLEQASKKEPLQEGMILPNQERRAQPRLAVPRLGEG